MDKEEILSEMENRVGKTSLSKRTLSDYVGANLPAAGTEPDEAFWVKHAGFLKSLDGNYSHDVSVKVEEFKKSYKPAVQPGADVPAKAGFPQEAETPAKEEGSEILQLLKGIKEENRELRDRLDKQDLARIQGELRKKVIDGMRAEGASDEYVLNNTLGKHGELDAKRPVDDLVKFFLAAYDVEFSACRGSGPVPRSGQPQQRSTKSDALKSFKERHQKAGDLPAGITG